MIRLDSVSKIFGTGVAGLSEINLLIDRGEFVFLVGHTGSGKTTLLRLIVRDMLPTSGTIIVSDFDVVKLPANKIPHLRKKVGVVFQDLKLLMDRTILENILLPMQVAGIASEGTKRAEELLQMVGLIEHKEKFPVQLSGGELQRVAIARALALSPEILLADEPTGNLDPQTAKEIVDLLAKINEMGTTIIMATHNLDIVGKMGKRVVALEKGKLIRDEKGKGYNTKSKDKEATEDVVEKKHHNKGSKVAEDTKETRDEENGSTENKETLPSIPSNGGEERSSGEGNEPQSSEVQENEKIEHHKKETKKLSDLLARARQSLHKHGDKKEEASSDLKTEENKEDMPFGFSKEEDVAQIDETGDDKEKEGKEENK